MVWVSPNRIKDLRLRLGWGWDGAYPKARHLQDVPLFAGCSPRELQTLVGLTSEVTVSPGTVICHEGQGPAQFVILTKGRLEVASNGASPHICLPGSYLPSSGTRLDVADLPTVRAESEVEIIVMNVAEFASMMVLVPSVRERLNATPRDENISAVVRPVPPVASPAASGNRLGLSQQVARGAHPAGQARFDWREREQASPTGRISASSPVGLPLDESNRIAAASAFERA